ncbi:hypothetical protein SAMN05421820_107213 [Pedobacter steynii]|uniref:DUF2059 domain-containing protein n=1 Tax=Pedobacter steynii TaxID=430522 RepID=A0A1H0AV59_9SPHI|nr:DUF2059 domain-containing protein [Pedobacter steynii]NQX41251.1 DUF2059 domain-containing protein [Pedobacter steynii]SDN37332.1 hypothetical protein SAMN05421820_107213 [Pedobacter steynii]
MKILIFLSLFVGLNLTVKAQSDSTTYKALLKEVINGSRTLETNKKIFHDMLVEMKKQPINHLSPQSWEVLEKQLNDFYEKDYPLLVYPIYKKYLSEEDLRNITMFNQTETGKRMSNFVPELTIQSISFMQIFGEKFVKSIKSLQQKTNN